MPRGEKNLKGETVMKKIFALMFLIFVFACSIFANAENGVKVLIDGHEVDAKHKVEVKMQQDMEATPVIPAVRKLTVAKKKEVVVKELIEVPDGMEVVYSNGKRKFIAYAITPSPATAATIKDIKDVPGGTEVTYIDSFIPSAATATATAVAVTTTANTVTEPAVQSTTVSAVAAPTANNAKKTMRKKSARAKKEPEPEKEFDWTEVEKYVFGKPYSEKESAPIEGIIGVKFATQRSNFFEAREGFNNSIAYSSAGSIKTIPYLDLLFFNKFSIGVEYDPTMITQKISFMESSIGEMEYNNYPTMTLQIHPLNDFNLGWDLYAGLTIGGVMESGRFSIGGIDVPVNGSRYFAGYTVGLKEYFSTAWSAGVELTDNSNLSLKWTAPEDITTLSGVTGGREVRVFISHSF
jgi:hypothetical protein